MSISSVSLPPAYQPLQQTQNTQQTAQQNPPAVQHAGTDSDGDNDGSGGAVNITPPVNIKA